MKQRFCGTYLAFMIQLATILHHYYLFKLENLRETKKDFLLNVVTDIGQVT